MRLGISRENMKNARLILCVTLLLMSVCLSGCQEKSSNNGNQQHTTENTFIGDWYDISSSPDNDSWSFYMNKTAKDLLTQDIDGQSTTTISWYDYTNDNTTLCFSPINQSVGSSSYFSECFSYSFSDNTTHLAFSSNGIVIMDMRKIS